MQPINLTYRQLTGRKDFNTLADALGETPETFIPAYCLRKGSCRAFIAGEPDNFRGAIIQEDFLPDEPIGFGNDPEIMWNLLKMVDVWDCIDVNPKCAAGLGEIIKNKMNINIQYCDDVYFTLTRPVMDFPDKNVRLLTLNDLQLLESAPKELQGNSFEDTRTLLKDGFIAAAIKSNKIVATAQTSARTNLYVDIGVFTDKKWRKYGFATAAASMVANKVQDWGKIPVWSADEDNFASIRVARKLGFKEVSRLTYIIPDKVKKN